MSFCQNSVNGIRVAHMLSFIFSLNTDDLQLIQFKFNSYSTSANAARFSSPVRILITLSTLYTKILPSPI